ncbi:MAG: hypothetical protein P1V51_04595 [Deltaproteobacteria bacterium]|nr:hypothetical protein [Deltaproteobacteria bacterium]
MRVRAALLLLLLLTLPGCAEKPAEQPAAAAKPATAATDLASERPITPGGVALPTVAEFATLLVGVSTQGGTFVGFVDEMTDASGDCQARLTRLTEYFVRANQDSLRDADRFFKLLPRYSKEQQQEATRLATPRFLEAMLESQKAAAEAPSILEGFRRECPAQAPQLVEIIKGHQSLVQGVLQRLQDTGVAPRPPGPGAGP